VLLRTHRGRCRDRTRQPFQFVCSDSSSSTIHFSLRERPGYPSLRESSEHGNIAPSKLAILFSLGRAPMLVYVRPSNEALLRARVPGAQGQRGCPSLTPLPLPPGHAAQRPLFVHRDQPRPRDHLSPFARSSEPPEDSPPLADAESARQKLDR